MRRVLLTSRSNGVATLTLSDPARLNALSVAVGEEFRSAVAEAAALPGLRAVVLTGAGKAFSAGGDLDFLRARLDTQPAANAREMLAFYERFLSVRTLPVPVVAAINGAAVGAGLCLAMLCDVRVAHSQARMGLNFATLGIHPGLGSTHFLPRLVGPQAANRMLLTGELITAAEAVRIGLVAEAVDDPLARASALADCIAAASPLAVRATLRTLRAQMDVGLPQALEREADSQAHCYAEGDLREGLAAVIEKRKARF